MVPEKIEPRYFRPFRYFEWIAAAASIVVGTGLIFFSTSSQLWNPYIEKTADGLKIGKVFRNQGTVQMRRGHSDLLFDLLEPTDLLSQDQVITQTKSIGRIQLGGTVEIQLLENTHLQFNTELDQGPRTTPSFLKGTIQAKLLKKKTPLSLKIHDQVVEILALKANSETQLEINKHSSDSYPLFTYTSLNETQISLPKFKISQPIPAQSSWEIHLDPHSPKIIALKSKRAFLKREYPTRVHPVEPVLSGPLQGTRFTCRPKKNRTVLLTWQTVPDPLRVELEISRSGKAYSIPASAISLRSAQVSLPCGNYTWKLRTSDSQGHASHWVGPSTFSLKENLEDEIPVTLIEHHELVKEEAQKKFREQRAQEEDEKHHQELLELAARRKNSASQHRKIASIAVQRKTEEKQKKEERLHQIELHRKLKYQPIADAAKQRKSELLE
jgi:hypothetical protein